MPFSQKARDHMTRLLVVSNRLPVTIEDVAGKVEVRPSSGGLVSALRPVLQKIGGCWIGSAAEADEESLLRAAEVSEGFNLSAVFLPANLKHDFYAGFCNEILWPLFHDLQSRCNFEPQYWHAYQQANLRFADAVTYRACPDDVIWVHDYHLMLQGRLLSRRFDRRNLFYFHHVPFPPPDVFEKLPWRKDILDAILGFGLVGFQTARDRNNFVACVRRILLNPVVKRTGTKLTLVRDGNKTIVGAFPIGIDFENFSRFATDPAVRQRAQGIRRNSTDKRLILGVDRLDYTKGILERIKGFAVLLERYPGLRGQVSLVQIAVPSREGTRHYAQLKSELRERVASVNARFATPGWLPIEYLNRHLSRAELVSFYCAADVALITPIKDGMNLVCKEFCASRVDERGVLLLSEFAGAVNQLKIGALLVNPYDAEGIATAIYHALHMDQRDIGRRMRRMRNIVQRQDVFWWCGQMLSSVGSAFYTPESSQSPAVSFTSETTDLSLIQEHKDANAI